jgi:hypothetical protein
MFSKFEAWNDILLNVNYAEAKCLIKGKLYIIKRGESILSLDNWAKRWGWDKSKVRRFMDLLKNDGMICLKTDNITTHLTVCKYEEYQDSSNANETRVKRKRNTNEIQTTPIKEEQELQEEEVKEEYNNLGLSIPKSELELTFESYLEMRRKIKKPATPHAIELIKKKLVQMTQNNERDMCELLNQSIVNSWAGIYPIKNNFAKKDRPTMRTTNEVFDNVIERIRNGEDTTVKIIGL